MVPPGPSCIWGTSIKGSSWSVIGSREAWLDGEDSTRLEPIDQRLLEGWSGSSRPSTSVCLGWLIFRAGSIEQFAGDDPKRSRYRPAIPASAFLLPVMVVHHRAFVDRAVRPVQLE